MAILRNKALFAEALAHAFGNHRRASLRCVWQENCKFLSSDPSGQISVPNGCCQDASKTLQHTVARLVPVIVVHLLEMVEIEDDQRGRRGQPLGAFKKGTPIEEAGEGVRFGVSLMAPCETDLI